MQNEAGEAGLAARVVLYLGAFGFASDSLTAGGPGESIRPLTEIIDFSGKTHTVERLASLLDVPLSQVRTASPEDRTLSTMSEPDVLVILGADAGAQDFAIEVSLSDDVGG